MLLFALLWVLLEYCSTVYKILYQGCDARSSCACLWSECTKWRGEVSGKEGQDVEWCSVAEIRRRDLPPADLPLVDAVERAAHLHAQTPLFIAT